MPTQEVATCAEATAYDAVLGMDVLQRWRLEYEGPDRHLYLKLLQ